MTDAKLGGIIQAAKHDAQCAVGQYILELVPWLFFIAGTVSLVLMDSVMILEQSAHIFWRLGPLLGAWGAPGGPKVGPQMPKIGLAGYNHPWRPQIGGAGWI